MAKQTPQKSEAEGTPPEVDPQQLGIEDALEHNDENPDGHNPALAMQPPAPGVEPDVEPEPLSVDDLAAEIADLDEADRRRLAQALEMTIALEVPPPSREGLKAGDYAELLGHAYVRFPDGTVVTASRQLLLGQPGEYVVSYWGEGQGEETFTVAEKGAEA